MKFIIWLSQHNKAVSCVNDSEYGHAIHGWIGYILHNSAVQFILPKPQETQNNSK